MRKKIAWKKCRKTFIKAIFFAFEKTFFKVAYKVFVISPAHKISHCLSANHNPELRCVICDVCYTFYTDFTLELHCFQPIRIE